MENPNKKIIQQVFSRENRKEKVPSIANICEQSEHVLTFRRSFKSTVLDLRVFFSPTDRFRARVPGLTGQRFRPTMKFRVFGPRPTRIELVRIDGDLYKSQNHNHRIFK